MEGARRARRDRRQRHAGRADGRRQGRHRHRQGDRARRARRGRRHQRDHRRRLHRLPAVPRRPVRRRHRHAGSRAREALRHRRREPEHPPLPGVAALAARLGGARARLPQRLRPVARRPRGADAGGRGDHAAALRARSTPSSARRCGSAAEVATDQFTSPPEPDVYGAERVATPPVPPELAPRDDVDDTHFVPAPCQVACPIGTDAPSLHRLHLGGQARGGVRGHHGDEPVLVGVRPRVRRPVRARLPPRRLRRPARDPQPQALRHGPARRHAPAAAGGGHARRRPSASSAAARPA